MSRTFEAATLPEALRMVRQTMGPDAFLLSTRSRVDELSGSTRYQVRASMGRSSLRSYDDLPGRPARSEPALPSWHSSQAQPSEISFAEAEEAPAADISFRRLTRSTNYCTCRGGSFTRWLSESTRRVSALGSLGSLKNG